MTKINISRRSFCQLIAASTTGSLLSGCDNSANHLFGLRSADATEQTLFASGLKDSHQRSNPYFVGVFDQTGNIVSKAPLPSRGHQVIDVPNKANKLLAFARRPGNWLLEIDALSGEISQHFSTAPNHHLFGHGSFSTDGKHLFTTEHAYSEHIPSKAEHGKIVVRDSDNYQVVAEYDCGGVGPHQCELMPDGKTLVIANGGIYTHPVKPRKKLNLDTMAPNLSYLDIASGKLLARYQPEHFQSSIRHLSVSKQGQVVMGVQQQNKQGLIEPLVYSHQGEEQLTPMQAQDSDWRKFKNYTASVCINKQGTVAAISSPRGNITSYWHLIEKRLISINKYRDGAGVGFHDNLFILTNGHGRIISSQALPYGKRKIVQNTLSQDTNIQWDNHLTKIS